MKFYKSNPLADSLSVTLSRDLIIVQDTVFIEPGKSKFINALVGYDTYEVKTITAKSSNAKDIIVSIYDKESTDRQEVYRSLSQPIVQDIAAIPIRDISGQKRLYYAIANQGDDNTNVTIEIKLVSL